MNVRLYIKLSLTKLRLFWRLVLFYFFAAYIGCGLLWVLAYWWAHEKSNLELDWIILWLLTGTMFFLSFIHDVLKYDPEK